MAVGLTPAAQRELREMLVRERDRIDSSLRSLLEAEGRLGASQAEEGAALGAPADVATDLAEEELDQGLAEAARRRRAEVDAALRRVQLGRYGICERCGADIHTARLRALPWARHCVTCAQHTST